MEAPVATLVVAGVLLLASAVQITASATTSSATVTTTTPTPATRPSATGLEFCDVPQPLHLVAGSQKSSTRLRLSPPLPQRPCRLEVTAPASNDLRLELVPVVPVVEADAASDAQEIPDENDDAYDRHRLALYEFRDALAARDRKEDDSRAAHRRGAAITNPGMEAVSLVRQDAERRGSTANASCNLALYVQGEVAWAVDLCDPKAIADANHPDSAFAKMPGPLTLVWTPPRPGLALRAAALSITAVRKEVPADNACTVGAVKLAGRGLESAMALELLDRRAPEDRAEPCRVTVEAPSSYLLSLLLVKVAAEADSSSSYYSSSAVSNESDGDLVEDEENAATEDAAAATTRPACGLKVILGCSTELWTVDLCDPAEAAALNTTELFPNNVTLVWTSPTKTVQRGSQRTPQATPQFATTVILTAIGRGATCKSSQFSSCWRRPRFPLCVSRELVCDGYHNCPMVGDDEDPNMCNPRHRLIETPGQEKEAGAERIIPDAKDLLYELLQSTQFNKFHPSNSSRGHDATLQGEASPDTLSNYGPWGYLMLGMLVCGAFLMLCGLWECCCRQPKPAPSAPSHTPTTVLMPQMGVSGGVLVLDSDLDDDPSRPPSYDDLDQPPAYGALFPPGQPKLDDDPVAAGLVLAAEAEEGPTPAPTSLMADAPFPEVDADDVPSLHSSPSSSSVTSTSSLAS